LPVATLLFQQPPPTDIYTLSLHDALPILRVEGGWSVTGTKLWTSGAQHAEAFIALCRTEPLDTSNRHAGLSQFIVDLRSAGVTIRPIVSLSGDHHFNEVVMDEVFVPDSRVF